MLSKHVDSYNNILDWSKNVLYTASTQINPFPWGSPNEWTKMIIVPVNRECISIFDTMIILMHSILLTTIFSKIENWTLEYVKKSGQTVCHYKAICTEWKHSCAIDLLHLINFIFIHIRNSKCQTDCHCNFAIKSNEAKDHFTFWSKRCWAHLNIFIQVFFSADVFFFWTSRRCSALIRQLKDRVTIELWMWFVLFLFFFGVPCSKDKLVKRSRLKSFRENVANDMNEKTIF